jgi:hypothetical protein
MIRLAILLTLLTTLTAGAWTQEMLMRKAYGARGESASAWTPASLASLVWLDASDAATLTVTSSNTISQIADKSGNGYSVSQATGARQPAYTNINSIGSIYFPASAWLRSATNFTIGGTQLVAIVLATEAATTTSLRELLAIAYNQVDYGANAGIPFYQVANTTNIAGYQSGIRGSAFIGLNTPAICVSKFTGTNHTMYVNGVSGTPAASSGTFAPNSGYTVGADGAANPSVYWRGHCAQVLMFKSISDADIQKVEGWAAWKYGIQSSLPTNHPYYGAAP